MNARLAASAHDPRALARMLSHLALAVAVQSLPVPGAFAVIALDGWGAMLQVLAPAPVAHGRSLLRAAGRFARRLRRPAPSSGAMSPIPARRA